jgi:hypothetical protein
MAPSGTGAPESQRSAPRQADPPEKVGGAAGVRSLALRLLRPSRLRLPAEALIAGKSLDSASTQSAPQAAKPGAAPRRLQSLLIRGSRAPDVHVSLVADGGHGQTPTVAEVGGSTPEQAGERVAFAEAADRSGTAPESAGLKRAVPEQGSSGRPVKKARVRSKM